MPPRARATRALHLAAGALLFTTVYAATLTGARYAMAEPSPRVDYLAELNRITLSVQPQGENAWPLYEHAADEYASVSDRFNRHAVRLLQELLNGDWHDPSHTSLKPLLSEFIPVLDAFHIAASAPACARTLVPDSVGSAPEVSLSHRARNQIPVGFDQLVRLNAIDLRAAAEDGDWDRALRRCVMGIRAAGHRAYHPLIEARIASSYAFDVILRETRRVVLELNPPADVCRQFIKVIDEAEINVVPASHFIRGERLINLDLLQRYYSDDGLGDGVLVAWALRRSRWLDEPALLERLSNVASISKPSRAEMRREIDECFERLASWADALPSDRAHIPPPVERFALPPNLPYPPPFRVSIAGTAGRTIQLADGLHTDRVATILILRIVAHRAERAAWPASLADAGATSDETVDAISGLPFIYELTAPDVGEDAPPFQLIAPTPAFASHPPTNFAESRPPLAPAPIPGADVFTGEVTIIRR